VQRLATSKAEQIVGWIIPSVSLRLGKKQENARSSGGHQLMLSFLKIFGNRQPIAVFVVRWNAIHQERVTVGSVSRDSIESELPCICDRVPHER